VESIPGRGAGDRLASVDRVTTRSTWSALATEIARSGSQRVAFWMLTDVATGGAAGVARRASRSAIALRQD